MKKANVLIALMVLTTGVVGYVSKGNLSSLLGAQIISNDVTLAMNTTNVAPQSPDFMNTFNLFSETKSELALLEKYSSYVAGSSAEMMKEYQTEIMSFVDRMLSNPKLSNYLPIWPDHNVATFGNTLSYLFPREANPLVYARSLGFVPVGAEMNAYMSRSEFLFVVGRIFVTSQRDPATVLAELGFIDSEEKWKDESKNGFPLVEGIRLIMNIRELMERKNIMASKQAYEDSMSYLVDGELTTTESTVNILARAFATETETELSTKVLESIQAKFKSRYGTKLNFKMISDVRASFFQEMNMVEKPVYELPELQLLGDCTNEVFRKTYMGSFAVTGPAGASIICDKVMTYIPANSYVVNVFSLPKITALEMNDQLGLATVRTDVMRSLKNSFVVSSKGEEMVSLVLRPNGVEKLINKKFGLSVEDQLGTELLTLEKGYSKHGGVLHVQLRSFSGDQISRFKYSL
jgi:hypothetical protein